MGGMVALDKTLVSSVSEAYGRITIRVVVLKRKKEIRAGQLEYILPATEDGEPAILLGEGPLDSYLERPKHGRQCVVFLINGQRQHDEDATFIARNLGFKHIRNRSIVIVDLDGLAPEATADIVQGSRQGLYEGKVYGAIRDRIIGTLKKDPDLERLETLAEQEIADLSTGGEAVKKKLDQLIEGHHQAGTHIDIGDKESGSISGEAAKGFGKLKQQYIVVTGKEGSADDFPVLTVDQDVATIRLRPDQERVIVVRSDPPEEWANLELIEARSPDENLYVDVQQATDHAKVELAYVPPESFGEDEYPLRAGFFVYARFKGRDKTRVLERRIVVAPPPNPKEKKLPMVLTISPTFIKITSHQPVELIPGGPSAHVRLRWDGDDSLVAGSSPQWTFHARCLSLANFPPMTFSFIGEGKLEILVDAPHGLLPRTMLDFEVEAVGPAGKVLRTNFRGAVPEQQEESDPRKLQGQALELTAQRKPNYQLKIVKEKDFDTVPCWEGPWTRKDAGFYSEPSQSEPLTLYINEDFDPLVAYRDELLAKKLDETTVEDRLARYTAHVAFHLYQMYSFVNLRQEQIQKEPEAPQPPTSTDLRAEVSRVANTIIKVSS